MRNIMVVTVDTDKPLVGDQMNLPMSASDVVFLLEACLKHLSQTKEVLFFNGYQMIVDNAGTMKDQIDEAYIVRGFEEAVVKKDALIAEALECMK